MTIGQVVDKLIQQSLDHVVSLWSLVCSNWLLIPTAYPQAQVMCLHPQEKVQVCVVYAVVQPGSLEGVRGKEVTK